MTIYEVEDYEEMSSKAADIIAAVVILKPNAVLGLATGSTPVGTYQKLIGKNRNGEVDFSKVQSVNLDEYVGLSGDHDQSYRYFMNTNLFDHINIRKECTHVPNGLAQDVESECAAYDALIESLGGSDIQLLGIGPNGHIGFNEPGDAFVKKTHRVTLEESTRQANSRFFDSIDDVPTHALTMGIGAIMSSRRVLLLASGAGKAQAVYDCVCGPITPAHPASILQLHPDAVIIADRAAMSMVHSEG